MKKIRHVILIICLTCLNAYPLTSDEKVKMSSALLESVTCLGRSADLSSPPEGKSTAVMSSEKEKEMYALMNQGINLSDKISDEFLEWAHPGLRAAYRENLIGGVKLIRDGYLTSDVQKQLEGIEKQLKWIEYFETNKDVIGEKLFPN